MAALAALLARSHSARFRLRKTLFIVRFWLRHRGVGSGDASQQVRDHQGEKPCGRYQVTNMVSSGGFSRLYEARDLHNSNTRVALKFLHVGAGREGWIRDRFAQEVAALRSIEHTGVVRILDSFVSTDGEPCLVMPFLEGPTLRAALQPEPFPAGRAARIIRRMGAALFEVHGRGIVHRDLKPENVILLEPGTEEEQPVLLDFGTAALRGPDDELAATTLLAGSFHYLAPERLTGHYSPASDVYAFGVIILEMLSGNRLSDLSAMFPDEEFLPEVTADLTQVAGAHAATKIAVLLIRGFHPEPKSRPRDPAVWAEEIAALLESS
jgi:serine/threonine protein kinase